MKRIWMPIMILSLFTLLFTPVSGITGSFEQLKNLKIDPKSIVQPKQNVVEFQFANFRLNPDSGDASRIWNVDLKITQSIAANNYLVKTAFQNRAGETLFSGDDIVLPAGNAGKTYPLTRPFQKEPAAARMILQVYNQAEGRIVASRTYPLAALSSYGIQGAATSASAKPAAARGVPESSGANPTANPDVAFIFDPDSMRRFQIQNKSSFPVRIDEISAKSKFLVGIDQDIEVRCTPRSVQPGQSAICHYSSMYEDCPTLSEVDIQAKLNGNTHHEELQFDAPIRRITAMPIIHLEKKNKVSDSFETAAGTAQIIIRGVYVKIGGRVTMKALASIDSDRFPVVFDGLQSDDGVHAEITVAGTQIKTPDKFCFNLMEITTCEELRCGGVGVLLYRDLYRTDRYGDVNIFLDQKNCK